MRLRGKFDNSKEMFISPRTLVKSTQTDHKSGGIFSTKSNSNVGAYVITPFVVKDRNIRILVNRGWIHRSRISQKRLNGQTDDEIDLIGVIRKTEKVSHFTYI